MSNEKLDIESLELHEGLRQAEGQCISCDYINMMDAKLIIEVPTDKGLARLLCLKGYCPVCGKRVKK